VSVATSESDLPLSTCLRGGRDVIKNVIKDVFREVIREAIREVIREVIKEIIREAIREITCSRGGRRASRRRSARRTLRASPMHPVSSIVRIEHEVMLIHMPHRLCFAASRSVSGSFRVYTW